MTRRRRNLALWIALILSGCLWLAGEDTPPSMIEVNVTPFQKG